jgi:site-specific recombinase XerD
MERLEVRRQACKVRGEDSPYVLAKSGGEPLYTGAVSDRVGRIHASADLGGRRKKGHHLRHCSASWTIHAGATLTQVQHHLGHKRASTTEKYIHEVRGSQPAKEVAGILDRVHGNAVATRGNTTARRQQEAKQARSSTATG